MAKVHFIRTDAHDEGSYSALVRVYGQEFAVHYVAGEIRVYGTAGQRGRRRWQITSAADAVRTAVAVQIEALGPAFAAAHLALYAPEPMTEDKVEELMNDPNWVGSRHHY